MMKHYMSAALRSGPGVAKAAWRRNFPFEVPMSAILMILVFLAVFIGLNLFEFGRPD
jgi:hypothetical protein